MRVLRWKGPRLGTKLMLLGLLLLIVPWFTYQQLVEMEGLLIQGQSQAQKFTAEAVSTLFNGRDDLFNDLPVTIEDYEALYAYPIQSPVRVDGDNADWNVEVDRRSLQFGSESGDSDGDFELLLGERGGYIYVYMNVMDQSRIYRNPNYLRLDNADQIRLSFIQTSGDDGRILITIPGPGIATAYEMDSDWRFAATGTSQNQVQAFSVETNTGYQVEFRLPLSLLGSRRYFGISFVDVDDPESRAIERITQTLPTAGKESFNLVVFRSPEVLNIIQGLGYAGARILVIDGQNRVRAETGSYTIQSADELNLTWYQRFATGLEQIRPYIHELITGQPWQDYQAETGELLADEAIAKALSGESITYRRAVGDGHEVLMALHPIISKDTVLGTVVVEQNIDDILVFQRTALQQVILLSITSLFAVFIALLAFAGRLAWRIRNLRREASAAIDHYGRLRTSELRSEMNAGDEIGELSRAISNMLSKLHQHNNFLETMPRTLRHEINNPLNTLSTSLQNLAVENPDVEDSKYLESAKRGVMRIGAIVQNLADAANLEESLEAEELEIVDIQQLLENYVANCRLTHPLFEFVFRGKPHPVFARIADYRIEQLLDKIIDNAIDFHRTNSPIKVQLDTTRSKLQITIANRGPVLPVRAEKSLFDSMVSHRGPQNRLHFGLGLYVVRVIAEYHGGLVRAINLTDGSGVAIVVQLPLAEVDQILSETQPHLVAIR